MDLVKLLKTMVDEGPISGEALAARAGVSRAAVWKGIEQLRAEGLGIDGKGGYRVVDPAGWGPSTMSWRTGRPVLHVPRCESTNDLARAAVQPAGSPQPVVVADHQTRGRGRLGRQWDAAPGESLLFSVVLRPDVPPAGAPRCLLLWAAAMAEVLDLHLKWPNDLVTADGRKVAGILAELETRAEPFGQGHRLQHVVLGVGVNVRQTAFPDLPNAASLAMLGRDTADRAEILGRLIRAIDGTRPHGSLDLWRARARTLGRKVRVGDIEGVATDVRDDGALLVDGQPILAGDVEMVGGLPGEGT